LWPDQDRIRLGPPLVRFPGVDLSLGTTIPIDDRFFFRAELMGSANHAPLLTDLPIQAALTASVGLGLKFGSPYGESAKP
jgi:hypothetical protein